MKAGRAVVLFLIVLGSAGMAGCTHVEDTVADNVRVNRTASPRVAQTVTKPRAVAPKLTRSASVQANRGPLLLGVGF